MKTIILALSLTLTVPAFARTDGNSSKAQGARIYQENARNSSFNTNPNSDRKCYYCYKDMNTQYNPSYKKYSKTL